MRIIVIDGISMVTTRIDSLTHEEQCAILDDALLLVDDGNVKIAKWLLDDAVMGTMLDNDEFDRCTAVVEAS